ncbi:DEAD/DEAH box helicase [Pseudoalteromonas lipolytica]|uniref:DEAD/DEAH box helicase n=1 Tax=Pseudoalteromonas lipolytica TaxID=570156 RepID=A0ABY1GC96_9GAMM|nr:DEAD/DEAH box helicase [Pseudoalteromonas lipolytica]MBE0350908.1 hypothetical protein [Pseudoalteromonas lipolytica LMEB 39]SFT32377.1 hypothetical protein SAMN04487854_10125 [Pseudoalteromonas lipolytica]
MSTPEQRLANIKAKLEEIETHKAALLEESRLLTQQLTAEQAHYFNQYADPRAKVALFQNYFRGRNNIYPFRWESKQGKSGYSPSCANEWKAGVCNKPKIACSECHHQAFHPLDENAINAHLRGQRTIGIYPLTEKNQCYFLAFDFDKADWFNAITALRQVCDSLHIPNLVEKSRSGHGGHLWLFFNAATNAKTARQLGTALLNLTMDNYPTLNFDCFDRMFPNQDELPEGGFGNLIALPLQKQPRMLGNASFIDKNGEVIGDQWQALASTAKITADVMLTLLERLKEYITIEPPELDSKPWEKQSPSISTKIQNCPDSIEIIQADKLYIATDPLPNQLIASLKKLAVFGNPEFFKRQAMRFSTIGVPRYLCAAHIESGYLQLPRGLQSQVENLLDKRECSVSYQDKRQNGQPLSEVKFTGVLRAQQAKALKALMANETGLVIANTGFGKTVVALALAAKREVNTLVLVHNKALAEQWIERCKIFLNEFQMGSLLGGKDKLTGLLDVATYQSLIGRNGVDINEKVYQYGQIIVDECHHIPALNYETLIKNVLPKYILGFTATPKRQDGLEKLMYFQLGDVLFESKPDSVQFSQTTYRCDTGTSFPKTWLDGSEAIKITQVYQYLQDHEARSLLIANQISEAVQMDRKCLVLSERKEHISILSKLLQAKGISAIELHGGVTAKIRKQRIADMQAGLPNKTVVIATGKYVGEGFDLPYLDALFLALPVSWKGTVAQYAGRIQRHHPGKSEVTVYDFVDDLPMLQRMWKKRANGYKAVDYTVLEKNQETNKKLI